MSSISDLLQKALQIKQETVENANSALRIGTALEEIIKYFRDNTSAGTGGNFVVGEITTEAGIDEAVTPGSYAVALTENYLDWLSPAFSLLVLPYTDSSLSLIQVAYNFTIDEQNEFSIKARWSSFLNEEFVFSAWKTVAGASSSKITTIDPTSIAVGGIPAGTVLTDKTTLEVIDMMLYPELFQQASGIVAPSSEFELSTTGLQEVGAELILSISHSFNRGSISPKYQSASEFRSGALIDYTETGSEGFYTVLPGVQSWTSKANYAAGVQPKGSKGTNNPTYGALPAGSTSTITRTITGVYPVYATTVNISVLTKQALLAHGAIVEVNLVAETGGNKQTVRIPSAWNITTLKQYNTLSGQWDSISLSTFTKSSAITLNGTTYYDYTHNGSTIGARKLRFE